MECVHKIVIAYCVKKSLKVNDFSLKKIGNLLFLLINYFFFFRKWAS